VFFSGTEPILSGHARFSDFDRELQLLVALWSSIQEDERIKQVQSRDLEMNPGCA
jgi:hypothetical protein